MIRFDDLPPACAADAPPADGRSRSFLGARHVRTFTEGEVLDILAHEVRRKAGHDELKVTGVAIRLASPSSLGKITIQVDVTEISR